MRQFTIYGEPIGKGRPKFSTMGRVARAITPEKTVNYENLVKLSYQQQCNEKPYDKDVQLIAQIYAYFPIPKSASKKKQKEMQSMVLCPTKKPDLDNIVKAVLDALNGIAFYDDSQIVRLQVEKYYSDIPRVDVYISKRLRGLDDE